MPPSSTRRSSGHHPRGAARDPRRAGALRRDAPPPRRARTDARAPSSRPHLDPARACDRSHHRDRRRAAGRARGCLDAARLRGQRGGGPSLPRLRQRRQRRADATADGRRQRLSARRRLLDDRVSGAGTSPLLRPERLLREIAQRAVAAAERRALLDALAASNDNNQAAAKLLGIGERTLWTKLEKLGIRAPRPRGVAASVDVRARRSDRRDRVVAR